MTSLLPLALFATLKAPVAPPPRAAFDFSTTRTPAARKGIVEKVLDRIDGGEFHGFDNVDGTTHKHDHEDVLHTLTIRFKFPF